MVKTIRTDEAVWAELQRLRLTLGLRTMDQVIRHLLSTAKRGRIPAKGGPRDPILALKSLGKEVWRKVEPDEYVSSLREGW